MIGSYITYFILAISGLIGSGIALDEIRKARHTSHNQLKKPADATNGQ